MLFYTAYNHIKYFARDSPHVPVCDNEIQHRPTRSTNQVTIKSSEMIRIKALRAITQPLKSIRFISTHRPNDIGFVFDIDGVLLRGKKPIPSARAALDLLNDHSIPYIFLTNVEVFQNRSGLISCRQVLIFLLVLCNWCKVILQ